MVVKQVERADIIAGLQSDILRLQGFSQSNSAAVDLGLGPITEAFPNGSFPLGAVHEFLSEQPEDAAATGGFIAGLLSPLMGNKGTALWISSSRTVFPPALKSFGIQPDRVVFIDLKKERDIMWVMEESLKCGALTAVVSEMRDVGFTDSRRLQLAVEKSQVTGFILRHNRGKAGTSACVSRWKITALPSIPVTTGYRNGAIEHLPGIGFPQWRVALLRIRNGRSGVWNLKWMDGRFQPVHLASEGAVAVDVGVRDMAGIGQEQREKVG